MAEQAFDMAAYVPRVKAAYEGEIVAQLKESFGYTNPMMVPRLDKVVLNMGIGEAVSDTKKVQSAADDLTRIAGQKAVITRARRSIATFKVREGMPIGTRVTLRGLRMYEFVDRLINVALPRQRDFRGLNPGSFDGRGNYALGIKEHIVFPEIDYDKVDEVWGMDVVVCTTAPDRRGGACTAEGTQFSVPPLDGDRKASDQMAKKSAIEKNKNRTRKVTRYAARRAALKALSKDDSLSDQERFAARLKLAKLPRNSAPSRLRNRCEVTGRPRGYYRKLKISRVALRELGNEGKIPGLVKSSW